MTKKILVLLGVCVLGIACSNNKQVQTTADGKKVYYSAEQASKGKHSKYQIIDQEFDNMLAPDSDYETLSDYELQACGANYLPPAEKLKKPQAVTKKATSKQASKVTTNKKVINTTNIYYLDDPSDAPASSKRKYSSTKTSTTSSSSSFDDEDEDFYDDDFE
ncbi:MAG: hypothetical protein J6V32_00110 [Elusimicrobiaceae bacterium]|nr:hypothetical protein [Elusimicrobiaceae bacterium]